MAPIVNSLKVLVFIDGRNVHIDEFLPKEIIAIAKEVKKLWPDDMFKRIWFDVETHRLQEDKWDNCIRVVCYRMPGKNERCEIPSEYLDRVLNNKIRIFPDMRPVNQFDQPRIYTLDRHEIEVLHVLE
jgi:hypothetical protein